MFTIGFLALTVGGRSLVAAGGTSKVLPVVVNTGLAVVKKVAVAASRIPSSANPFSFPSREHILFGAGALLSSFEEAVVSSNGIKAGWSLVESCRARPM